MSDWIDRLVNRSLGREPVIEPRIDPIAAMTFAQSETIVPPPIAESDSTPSIENSLITLPPRSRRSDQPPQSILQTAHIPHHELTRSLPTISVPDDQSDLFLAESSIDANARSLPARENDPITPSVEQSPYARSLPVQNDPITPSAETSPLLSSRSSELVQPRSEAISPDIQSISATKSTPSQDTTISLETTRSDTTQIHSIYPNISQLPIIQSDIQPDIQPDILEEPSASNTNLSTQATSQISQSISQSKPENQPSNVSNHLISPRAIATVTASSIQASQSLNQSVSTPMRSPDLLTDATLWKESSPASPPPIHITIGRIEIRAVSAPPPPAPRRSPATPQRSLQDYLNARNGGTQ